MKGSPNMVHTWTWLVLQRRAYSEEPLVADRDDHHDWGRDGDVAQRPDGVREQKDVPVRGSEASVGKGGDDV